MLACAKSATVASAKAGEKLSKAAGCADCGEFFQHNLAASLHESAKPRHRMVWWTGHAFEEA